MGMQWLNAELSLSAALALEAARREVPRLHRHDLEAQLDQALLGMTTQDHMLRQALARVIELEARLALVEQPDRYQRMATEVLQQLTPTG
jgi:hypothetical protein